MSPHDQLAPSLASNQRYQSRPAWPMDPQITDIQPGGGIIIHWEQRWGRLRRWWLTNFRADYVRRMAHSRQGQYNVCPHPVLDPRDTKFYRNQGGYYWKPEDDPFAWRDRLPFARDGLAELLVLGGGFSSLTLLSLLWSVNATGGWALLAWLVTLTSAAIAGLIVWFFRNPNRQIPQAPHLVVAPADGTISDVERLDYDEYIGGPAVKVGIFLSIFNVHINRAPVACRVVGLKYQPGKYLNALRPESARENEQVALMLESRDGCRPMIVRQITGAIARRIVCWVKPDDRLEAGQQFGMIKLGSRTELLVPDEPGLELRVQKGDKIKAGSTVLLSFSQ
ncbi:MAG: phosphatidylserine decarboxylase family protein [Pirellulaceae bacterium]|nr:phosphatidylserine decarboxylase family protein [Pirellulaceae bacterium]